MPRLRALLKSPPLAKDDAEQQLEELRDYLLQIVEELGYLLTHIEADNINDTTFERISQMIPKAFTGTPTMDGEGSPGTAPTWARGDHTHPKDSSKADVTALAAHIADRLNPHAVTKAQVGLGNVADERQYSAQNPPPVPSAEDVGAIPAAEKGSAGGVAELDANGMVPSAQLPSYVDDVLEYASLSVFPVTGESGKIYVALDTNKTYRWSGSAYVEISESLALGETSSTAYRGDRGKAAYDHSQLTSGNPHNVTASDVGARPDTWTPSKSDIGLGNVDNVQQYSADNPPPYPVTSVNGNTGAVTVSVPSAYASNPEMDGTASPGSSGAWAKGDHVHPHDTSKANQTDLASIRATGSTNTTGERILADEYFYLNGTLVQAITDIPNGGSFTSGTNYEAVVDGGLNDLKTLVGNYIKYVSSNSNANITLPRGYAFIAIAINGYYGIRSCVILSRYNSGNSLRIDPIVTDSRYTWTAVNSSTVNVATSYGECQVFFTRIA